MPNPQNLSHAKNVNKKDFSSYFNKFEIKVYNSCGNSNIFCIFVGKMKVLANIAHPFQTVEEFQQLAGKRLGMLIHHLAGKYPQLQASCGIKRVLVCVSVAWELMGIAKAGNEEPFAYIDDALSPVQSMGCFMEPAHGCVMVAGQPFYIPDEERFMLHFVWDGFAIFIDNEGVEMVKQAFFDFADSRQTMAYKVLGAYGVEEEQEEHFVDDANVCQSTVIEKEILTDDYVISELVDDCISMLDRERALQLKNFLEPLCRKETGRAADIFKAQAERLEYMIKNDFNKNLNKKNMGNSVVVMFGDYVEGDKVMGDKNMGGHQSEVKKNEKLAEALTQLMAAKREDGKDLFCFQNQWYAVYRVMVDDYGWGNCDMPDFCRRINALGINFPIACKVESLKPVNAEAPYYKRYSDWTPQGPVAKYDGMVMVVEKFRALMSALG